MAAVVPFLPIIGAGLSAVGALSQAQAASNAAKSQADAATYNAIVAQQNAQRSLEESAAEQAAQHRQARRILGEQRAAIAQSGTGFGGTNADLIEQSETLAELDMLNIAYAGQSRARAYQQQSQLDLLEASSARARAKSEKMAGYFGAGRSLLGGFSDYARGRG